MKKFFHLPILFAVTIIFFSSCWDEEVGITGFSIENDIKAITAYPHGGIDTLQVNSEYEWYASIDEPWVSISPANGMGITKCYVTIDSTLSNTQREAVLTFTPTIGEKYSIKITQGGYGKQIIIADTTKTIPSSTNSVAERHFKMEVSTNVNFKLNIVDEKGDAITWLIPKQTEFKPNLDRGSRFRSTTLKFDWKINVDTAKRKAFVHFLPLDAVKDTLIRPTVLELIQEAAPIITDDRAGDSLAIVTVMNRLQLLSPWDVTENMQYWNNVTLWKTTDEEIMSGEVPREAIGRVRKANFMMCNTKESIPQELRYLRYIETLNIYSNVNTMLLSIELGDEICNLEYLKHLQIGAFGLVSLPDSLVNLKKLESLDLNSNNFPEIPAILTEENFPNLKSLDFTACRRWTLSDLRKKDDTTKVYAESGIGLHFNTNEDDALKRLLLWENLEELRLSNNYIEGQIPDFIVGEDGVESWSDTDRTIWGDTINSLIEEERPKILPNMKRLTLNLNFFTGELPDWLLYHPHLLDWFPESLIYMQQVNAFDSNGRPTQFDNEPTDYEYYFKFFPKFRSKYEVKEEIE